MITRTETKSCCGAKSLIFTTTKPIRKSQIQPFKDAGFLVPQNWLDLGIFNVAKDSLVATTSFGSNKINVRCRGNKCAELLDLLESILEIATNS